MDNRTIKFRAWDEKLKRWEYWGLPEDAGYIAGRFNKTNATKAGHRFSSSTFTQFTGLTDKNGKEIYEGDIVKIEYSDFPSYVGKIDWANGYGFGFYGHKDNGQDLLLDVREEETGARIEDGDIDSYCLEVIGNVYKHEHLLKK